MNDSLWNMVPDDPAIRAYLLDLGFMTYLFDMVENRLVHYLELSWIMSLKLNPPHPAHATKPRLEKATLGRLIREFEGRLVESEPVLLDELRAVNADRISVIHRTRRIVALGNRVSYDGMLEARAHFRTIAPRALRAAQAIRPLERRLLQLLVDEVVAREGADSEYPLGEPM